MIRDPVVMLDNLVLSLSDALDLVHPYVAEHQQRVAYIAVRLGQAIGVGPRDMSDLMRAAALHDIGVLSVEEKVESMKFEFEGWGRHVDLGADLLRRIDAFAAAAGLVRFHHQPWGDKVGWWDAGDKVRILSNAIHLADVVDRRARRGAEILGQVKALTDAVSGMSGSEFSPRLVECFRRLAGRESFWFDFASPRITAVLGGLSTWPRAALPPVGIDQVGEVFCRVVDFRSAFTATHSAGVAAAAEELAWRLGFGKRERRLIRLAGHLHDLGKMCVPNAILEKPTGLDPKEVEVIRGHAYYTYHILSSIGGFEEIGKWAAYHHEHLDGTGYPFHLAGDELPLGSRIMCVADVFTAITERRPYRRGEARAKTMPILRGMVRGGSLDGRIVGILDDHYEEIDGVRSAAQSVFAAEYAERFAPAG